MMAMKCVTMKPLSYYADYEETFIKKKSLKKLFIQFRKCLDYNFRYANYLNEKRVDLSFYFKDINEYKTIEFIMKNKYEIWTERELVNAYMELTNTPLQSNSFLITYETKYKMNKNKKAFLQYLYDQL